MNRRNFCQMTSLSLLAPLASEATQLTKKAVVRIGICSDLHHDLIPDSQQRLGAFVEVMNNAKVDFIIQLGDFCQPKESNQPLMALWESFQGEKYHVIGNHDTDGGYSHQQVVNFWKIPHPYYSFDKNGYHFVVLNGNDKNPNGQKGYPRYIGQEQRQWLKQDIENTNFPVIIFCHQGLDNDNNGLEDATSIKLIFEEANQKAGFQKVRLVLTGHHHQDYYNHINDIHYVQINSMSYFWIGERNKHSGYEPEIEQKYPWLKAMAMYEGPIWAMLAIYADGRVEIQGTKTEFMRTTQAEVTKIAAGVPYPIVPYISDRKLKI